MTIRSFVLRGGRLTEGQQRALDKLYPRLGIAESGDLLDFPALFERTAPTILEIGFGNGESTWRMAQNEPDTNFVAVEVHAPGVGRLLMALDEHEIGNCRVYRGDAVPFVRERIPPASLAGVRIYFPDPWHKKRHNKRRLIQPGFVQLLATQMQPGGVLHVATDWEPYAEHIMEVLEASPLFDNSAGANQYTPHPDWRPATKYEARGDRLGHQSRDLVFTRTGEPSPGKG